MGFPISIASLKLTENRNVKKLSEIARESKNSDRDYSHSFISTNSTNSTNNVFMLKEKMEKLYGKGIDRERQVVNIASEIMSTDVISLVINIPEKEVWQSFNQFNYRHFPVVNNEQRLVGIITDRDILKIINNSVEDKTTLENKPLEQLMTQPVLSASQDTNIKEICTIMFNYHIGAVPITDKLGHVIGIITRSDILRAMIKFGPTELWV